MALELRKVKVHEDMSEETTCFSAEMWENGVLIGYVKNDGQGGPDLITPTQGNAEKAYKYEENFKVEHNRENQPIPYLVTDFEMATKYQSKKLIFREANKESYYHIGWNSGLTVAKVKDMKGGLAKIREIVEREEAKGNVCLNRNI